jgi:large subunit ribosomal protein L32
VAKSANLHRNPALWTDVKFRISVLENPQKDHPSKRFVSFSKQSGRMSALRGLPSRSPLLHTHPIRLRPNHIRHFHLALNAQTIPVTHLLPDSKFILPSITSIIPIITGIWEAILRAVPKKKTTHSQKRKRQLVGKALQDKKNLTRCEACGDWKLLHTLCASCVKSIQKDWRNRERLGEL